MEGPFGEFTGYYGRPEDYAFLVELEAVHHRDDPILTHALMADYPANECALLYAVARSARIWNDLDRVGVPGIKGVYAHPAAAGGFGMPAWSTAISGFSRRTKVRRSVYDGVAARWASLGFHGTPPTLWRLDESATPNS